MIELSLHAQKPETLPTPSREQSRQNLLRIYGGNAVDLIVSGAGSVTVYVWKGPAGWRKHPQGLQLQDNESYYRLVLGRQLTTEPRYLLVVSAGSPRVWAQVLEY